MPFILVPFTLAIFILFHGSLTFHKLAKTILTYKKCGKIFSSDREELSASLLQGTDDKIYKIRAPLDNVTITFVCLRQRSFHVVSHNGTSRCALLTSVLWL